MVTVSPLPSAETSAFSAPASFPIVGVGLARSVSPPLASALGWIRPLDLGVDVRNGGKKTRSGPAENARTWNRMNLIEVHYGSEENPAELNAGEASAGAELAANW